MSTRTSRTGIPLFCVIALISGSGCTTTRIIDPQSRLPTASELKSGDTVKVTLTDGSELDIIFLEETAEHIIGRDRQGAAHTISRQDIAFLEARSLSTGKNLLLVGGIVLIVGVVQALADTAEAYDCLLGGPC